MSDLISRKKAFDMLSEYYHHRLDSQHLALREALSRVPSVEPNESDCWKCNCPKMERLNAEPERKKGKWIYNSPVTMNCNQCGLVIKDWDWHRFNYCPNCGARMDGESESLKFWNLGKYIADGIEAGIKGESE